jgi:hypothetical protein
MSQQFSVPKIIAIVEKALQVSNAQDIVCFFAHWLRADIRNGLTLEGALLDAIVRAGAALLARVSCFWSGGGRTGSIFILRALPEDAGQLQARVKASVAVQRGYLSELPPCPRDAVLRSRNGAVLFENSLGRACYEAIMKELAIYGTHAVGDAQSAKVCMKEWDAADGSMLQLVARHIVMPTGPDEPVMPLAYIGCVSRDSPFPTARAACFQTCVEQLVQEQACREGRRRLARRQSETEDALLKAFAALPPPPSLPDIFTGLAFRKPAGALDLSDEPASESEAPVIPAEVGAAKISPGERRAHLVGEMLSQGIFLAPSMHYAEKLGVYVAKDVKAGDVLFTGTSVHGKWVLQKDVGGAAFEVADLVVSRRRGFVRRPSEARYLLGHVDHDLWANLNSSVATGREANVEVVISSNVMDKTFVRFKATTDMKAFEKELLWEFDKDTPTHAPLMEQSAVDTEAMPAGLTPVPLHPASEKVAPALSDSDDDGPLVEPPEKKARTTQSAKPEAHNSGRSRTSEQRGSQDPDKELLIQRAVHVTTAQDGQFSVYHDTDGTFKGIVSKGKTVKTGMLLEIEDGACRRYNEGEDAVPRGDWVQMHVEYNPKAKTKVVYAGEVRTIQNIMDNNSVQGIYGKPLTSTAKIPPKCKDSSGRNTVLCFVPRKSRGVVVDPVIIKKLCELPRVEGLFVVELKEGILEPTGLAIRIMKAIRTQVPPGSPFLLSKTGDPSNEKENDNASDRDSCADEAAAGSEAEALAEEMAAGSKAKRPAQEMDAGSDVE